MPTPDRIPIKLFVDNRSGTGAQSEYGEGTAGGPGGGIYNTGTLLVSDCIVRTNVTGDGGFGRGKGGDGGGIYNRGRLTLERATVSGNHSGNGAGDGAYDPYRGGGAGGDGGGLANAGILTATQSATP